MNYELKVKSEERNGREQWYIEGLEPLEWFDDEESANVAMNGIIASLDSERSLNH